VNVLLMVFGGRPLSVPGTVDGSFTVLGALVSYERLIAFGGALLVALLLTLALRKTSLGLAIRAVSSNSQGAALVGVNVGRIYALTFAIGSACVAVAGGLVAPFISLTPSVGEQFTILAFVIVVLGGLGSVVGATVGGLVIGLVQTVGALYLPGTGSLILVFAVFVLVLFFRPQGMFGAKQ
jgi:branched-chain amino acid transport system permease protein